MGSCRHVPGGEAATQKGEQFRRFHSFPPHTLERGRTNGAKLVRELKEQGYQGSERTVYRYLEAFNQTESEGSEKNPRLPQYSANMAVWLFVRNFDSLGEVEQEDVTALRQTSRVLDKAYRLVQDFFSLLHQREGHRLERWLAQGAKAICPNSNRQARGVERDQTAVQAGLTWEINNGQ